VQVVVSAKDAEMTFMNYLVFVDAQQASLKILQWDKNHAHQGHKPIKQVDHLYFL
jgi:hypothetical protein